LLSQDPEAFKPDRWLPSDPDAEKLKELYHPFSMGKRNCVGQNLALLEMKMVLATVFRSFRFELVSEVDHDYFLTLKPINAHMRVYNA
jgi:cytochrome P450